MADAFSASKALSYNQYATWQQTIAQQLGQMQASLSLNIIKQRIFEQLEAVAKTLSQHKNCQTIALTIDLNLLELGCGTGFATQASFENLLRNLFNYIFKHFYIDASKIIQPDSNLTLNLPKNHLEQLSICLQINLNYIAIDYQADLLQACQNRLNNWLPNYLNGLLLHSINALNTSKLPFKLTLNIVPNIQYKLSNVLHVNLQTLQSDMIVSSMVLQWLPFDFIETLIAHCATHKTALALAMPTSFSFKAWQLKHALLNIHCPLLNFFNVQQLQYLQEKYSVKQMYELIDLPFKNNQALLHYFAKTGAYHAGQSYGKTDLKKLLQDKSCMHTCYEIVYLLNLSP